MLFQEQNGRFIRSFTKEGRPTKQPVGRNTLATFPAQVATFLKKENPGSFTGHCWRRSGATTLVSRGSTTLSLQRAGGWSSSKVAESYAAQSDHEKHTIADKICNVPYQFHDNKVNIAPSNTSMMSFTLNNCTVTINNNINNNNPLNSGV